MLLADLPAQLLRVLLASLRAQLYVAAGAAVTAAACMGVTLGGGPATVAIASWWLLAMALVTWSATCAAHGGMPLRAVLRATAARGVVQGACLGAPMVVLVVVVGFAARLQPLLGLLLVPVAFVACVLLAGPAALVPGAIAAGDRAWLPWRALAAARAMPWRLAGIVLVGSVLVALAMLPAVLGGLLLTAVLGPLGFVGYGLGAAVGTPIIGAASILLWERIAASPNVAAPNVEVAAGQPAVAAPTWLPGPSWHAAFDASGMWGTWLQMPAAGQVAVQVVVPPGLPMRALLHGADGAWIECGELPAPGAPPLVVSLAAGATWLQLQAALPVADLVLDVELLVPSIGAASAA